MPLVTWVFNILERISPLTIANWVGRFFNKSWEKSYLAVEIYVIAWFSLLISFIFLVYLGMLPPVIVLVFLLWRLLDILQSWFNVFMDIKPRVLSPVRSLILAAINYSELAIIFGLMAFIFKGDFYPSFHNITQALRYSIGVITTTGSRFDPATIVGGLIYYVEIAFGIAFLAVVISRIISLFVESNSKTNN